MTEPDSMPAFFAAEGDLFLPQDVCRGFWQHDSLHGRAIVGLLGRELERCHGAPGLIPVRMTADMHRMAPFGPVRVETRRLRDGGRLRLAEAVLFVGDSEYARATCQFLAPSEPPVDEPWTPGPWDAPLPEDIAPPARTSHISEERIFAGSWGSPPPRKTWLREKNLLVAGEEFTPWTRLATSADFGSPWAHSVPRGIRYINTDITTMIHRLPEGEWIGFEATGHEASQGIAVGHCRIHDIRGPIGYVTATALAMKRRK